MPWSISEDVTEFTAAAGPFLRAQPARNTVALTVTESLLAQGPGAFGEDPPLFGWWQPPGGPAAAAFLQTPPYPLLLTGCEQAMPELAANLAAAGRRLPGVSGDAVLAESFAAQWSQLTGEAAAVHQRNRLYRLGELRPPVPGPPGAVRAAAAADRDLLVRWWREFGRESGSLGGESPERNIDDRISYGGLSLWETAGEAVSMAGLSRQVAGMVRVGPVYTPPALRRRGYAGALTAAVSRSALRDGAGEVLLFTDLANPTSNALYQRLGYEPVEDRVILFFTGRRPRPGRTG